MQGVYAAGFALFMLFPLASQAATLSDQLNQFFQARYAQSSTDVAVVVRTPKAQWPTCEQPRFSLPANARPWGNLSVQTLCGQDRRFIQVQVQATGEYVVATRAVLRGESVAVSDMKRVQGRLDTLPARAVTDETTLVDAIALRDLVPGQPVTLSMVRQPWRIKAGQNVQVIAQGEGFSAVSEGRAMNNATATQPVRVRMASGQIVSGRADKDGNILITL